MHDMYIIHFMHYSTVVLQVTNELEERTIYNVIGTIYGRMEPGGLFLLSLGDPEFCVFMLGIFRS